LGNAQAEYLINGLVRHAFPFGDDELQPQCQEPTFFLHNEWVIERWTKLGMDWRGLEVVQWYQLRSLLWELFRRWERRETLRSSSEKLVQGSYIERWDNFAEQQQRRNGKVIAGWRGEAVTRRWAMAADGVLTLVVSYDA
jgi:hypothetical protein